MKYKTISITLEGAFCGPIWQPGFDHCGVLIDDIVARPAKGQSLESLARRYLLRYGGDFQCPRFTEDTCIVVMRRAGAGAGRQERYNYRYIPILRIAPELVARGTNSADYG